MSTVAVTTLAALSMTGHDDALDGVATLTYHSIDPLAVSMSLTGYVVFGPGDAMSKVEHWRFARELIAQALDSPGMWAGSGDVRVLYHLQPDQLTFGVIAVNCDAFDEQGLTHRIVVDANPIAFWLRQTFDMVGRGQEKLNLDFDSLLKGNGC